MTTTHAGARARYTILALGLLLAAALGSGCNSQTTSSAGNALPANEGDPRAAQAFVRPADLAATLAGAGEKPLLLHVGFQVLYRGGAIPGSKYVGPGANAEGIASLKAAVQDVPHDKSIVVYCGCCPWDHCPNMGPAFTALGGMGFTNVRALYMPKNLETDWINHGYPVEQPTQ